jgi:hypothetical protein
MQARLTRKLMAMLLGGALCAALPALASADDKAALQGAEQAAYLDGLKRLYLTDNERQALLAHSNALLETYALRAGYQVGQAQRQDLLYHFSVGGAGELVLREETRGAQGTAIAVRNQRGRGVRYRSVFHPLRMSDRRYSLRAVQPGRRQPAAEHPT